MTRIQNCSLAYQDNLGNIERQFFRFDTIFKAYITESLFRKKIVERDIRQKKKKTRTRRGHPGLIQVIQVMELPVA